MSYWCNTMLRTEYNSKNNEMCSFCDYHILNLGEVGKPWKFLFHPNYQYFTDMNTTRLHGFWLLRHISILTFIPNKIQPIFQYFIDINTTCLYGFWLLRHIKHITYHSKQNPATPNVKIVQNNQKTLNMAHFLPIPGSHWSVNRETEFSLAWDLTRDRNNHYELSF